MKHLITIFLFVLLTLSLAANSVTINSRYNYYTSEKNIILLVHKAEKKVEQVVCFVNGKVFKTPLQQYSNGPQYISLKSDVFKNGTTQVKCNVKFADRTNTEIVVPIVKLKPKKNEVKVDHLTSSMIVDNMPFYPFGFYTGYDMGDLPFEEIYNGFNMLGAYQKIKNETLESRKEYMDKCAAAGFKVNYHLNTLVGSSWNQGSFGIPEEEQKRREVLLRKEVELFKDHPALLSWYINDEPIGQGRTPAEVEKAYKIVKELDPYHPVTIVFMMPQRANEFENAMDIAMTDPYPIPGPLYEVGEAVAHLRKHFKYKKGIWLVPQAFGGGEMWKREPTRSEIRATVYSGLLEGAMGMKAFIRKRPNNRPKSKTTWMEYASTSFEIKSLLPWLTSDEGSIELNTGYSKMKARAWKYKGSWLVIVVNQKNRPYQMYTDISRIMKRGWAKVLFEDRKMRVASGMIDEFIDAYGTRVYLLGEPQLDNLTAHKSNLTLNPGFEGFTNPGVPKGCYATNKYRNDNSGATYFVDSRTAVEGVNSLRMYMPKDTMGNTLSFYKCNVHKGQSYRLSVWAKCKNANNRVDFKLSTREIKTSQTFTATGEWQEYYFYIKNEKDISGLHIKLESLTKGTIWFDLLQLVPDPDINILYTSEPAALITLTTSQPGADIRYSLGGKLWKFSTRFKDTLKIKRQSTLKTAIYQSGKELGRTIKVIPINKAMGKKVTYHTPYADKYKSRGKYSLVDGEVGTTVFSDGNWQGFEGKMADIEIDMGAISKFSSVTVSTLVSVNDGIHPPTGVEVLISNDGKRWSKWSKFAYKEGSQQKPSFLLPLTVKGRSVGARFIRIKVGSVVTIPKGFLFSGTKAWTFVDEIQVR